MNRRTVNWTYLKATLTGEVQTGPIDNEQFKAAIRAGHVKPSTKVHVNGKWTVAKSVPFFVDQVRAIKAEAKQRKADADAEKAQLKQENARNKTQQQVAQQQAASLENQKHNQMLASKEFQGEQLGAIKTNLDSINGKLSTLTFLAILWSIPLLLGLVAAIVMLVMMIISMIFVGAANA